MKKIYLDKTSNSLLDKDFLPAAVENQKFLDTVKASGKGKPLVISLENNNGDVFTLSTTIFSEEANKEALNNFHVERLLKALLWSRGGWKITIGGSKKIYNFIKNTYSTDGVRKFDVSHMCTIFEKPISVIFTEDTDFESSKEKENLSSYNLDGNRIGFDLGASDRKVSAVINGETVFCEEVVWNPSEKDNPNYHYHEIMSMLHHAAAHLPSVDAIGGSAAGVYINNLVRVASLFRSIPNGLFEKKIKNIFLDIQKKWGVPLKVINDGEVTALAASMELKKNAILGIAMGSSEAGGYINRSGNFNPWINEIAFIPVDYSPSAPIDEWSGDKGCGVQYFSQQAVVRLSKKINIDFDNNLTAAEKLKYIQDLMIKGDERVVKIFYTIGYYLGFSIIHYSRFYDIENIYLLGRVTSGEGGQIIKKVAEDLLKSEFPLQHKMISIFIPDESSRRIGQSIAAASLPQTI